VAPDVVLFGGDIASGPFPRETVDLVRSLDAVCVLGNADLVSTPLPNPAWDAGRRWVEAQLDSEQIDWLARLPFSWSADDTLYVHANPADVDGVVTELTTDARIGEYVRDVRESRVVTGHVHMQFERRVDGVQWLGVGSVGMPYEGRPGAYWAVLEPGTFEFRRTKYGLEQAAEAIRGSGHPQAEELATQNILRAPSREDALAVFGG
jgi:predicted phosphodiesterase